LLIEDFLEFFFLTLDLVFFFFGISF